MRASLEPRGARLYAAAALAVAFAARCEDALRADEPHKRALIVAIAGYARGTGWGRIHSNNDVPLIRSSLMRHGFVASDIHDVTDSQATKKGILDAIRTYLLTPARPGDVLVFHYSGHGQQITDDDGDELDGYDEALVPYDAPMVPRDAPPGYTGERHLRDDEINRATRELRRKVGPSGNVVLFIDSCYSGTIARGAETGAVRGGPPFGPPRATPTGAVKPGGGFYEPAASGGGPGSDPSLAPFVVFSAARNDERAFEAFTSDGTSVGSLSFALSAALGAPAATPTYGTLFERVKWEMQKWVRNEPQVEGNVDSALFSGRAVKQSPYVEVASVTDAGDEVTLAGGSVSGLLQGAAIEFHRAGTLVPSPASRVADGRVVRAAPLAATVTVAPPASAEALRQSRAFVTRYSFGDLRIRVQLDHIDADVRAALDTALANVAAVEVSDERPDAVLTVATVSGRRTLTVQSAVDGVPLFGPAQVDDLPGVAACAGERLQDWARNRYLRRLLLKDPTLDAALDVVPVSLQRCANPAAPNVETCQIVDGPLDRFMTLGHQLEMPVDSMFRLKLRSGPQPEYVTVLDLVSDGQINVLWPPPGAKDQAAPNASHELGDGYRVKGPLGSEVLLLVATDHWVDFGPFQTFPCGSARGQAAPGPLGAFDVLFDSAAVRSRSERVGFGKGSASTYAIPITVVSAPAVGGTH